MDQVFQDMDFPFGCINQSKYKICGYNSPRGCSNGSGGCLDFGSTPQGLEFDFSPDEYLEVSGGPLTSVTAQASQEVWVM